MSNRKLFIGCSREAKDKCDVIDWVENEIKTKFPNIDTFVWNSHGTPWTNGLSTLVNLVEFTKEFHYAVFVFFPDDLINIKGIDYYITRDNVSFEAGLFYSQFGNERTFIFKPTGLTNAITTTNFRVLTDIDGIVFTEYKLDYDVAATRWAVDKTNAYTTGQLDNVIKAIGKKETEIATPPANIKLKIDNISKKIETHTTQTGMTDEYYIGHFIEHFHV